MLRSPGTWKLWKGALFSALGAAFLGANLLNPACATAAEKKPRLRAGQYNPDHDTVELFAAQEEGQIDVKFIPANDREGRIIIKNNLKKPVNVRLPDAFAGVPVLAQFGGGGQQGGGFGGGQQGGGNQGVGGGGQQGGGFGGQQGGGGGQGFFNVPAEKVGNVKVQLVCLEHGKDNPRPQIPYRLIPIAEFTSNPAVHELCAALGRGECDQRAAQFAAWHLSNGMSYEELASKRIEHLNGQSEPYFQQDEVARGVRFAQAAKEAAKNSPGATSPATASKADQPATSVSTSAESNAAKPE